MSESYVLRLERLRVKLQEILEDKGFIFSGDTDLSTLVNKVDGIGTYNQLKGILSDTSYVINDTEGEILNVTKSNLAGTKITSVNLPNATSLCISAFRGCTQLTEAILPNVLVISGQTQGGAFRGCTSLTTVSIPKVKTVGEECFYGCTSLRVIDLPNTVETFGNGIFSGCTSLTTATLNCSPQIRTYFFNGCTNLTKVIITHTTGVVPLQNVNAFTNTVFRTGDVETGVYGTVYAPSDLVDDYEGAAVWSTGSSHLESTVFKDIESNINLLREEGVSFSKTSYANKKWENGELVYDATIGEEEL